jgi:site-specific DNA-methyltransferase (adenine-specific)
MIDLYNENCLDVLSRLDEESVDMVLCDPPYLTTPRGNSENYGGFLDTHLTRIGKGGFEENSLDIEDYLPLLYRCMKQKSHGYIMTNDVNLINFHLAIANQGFHIFKTLIWAKNNVIANQWYMNSHEYLIFFRKGGAKCINNAGTRSVLNFRNPQNKVHPSEKPIDLLKVLIENSSNEHDVVLDFTMGSGTTGMACKELNRKFIGIELDRKFFELAEKRIQNHSWQLSLFG